MKICTHCHAVMEEETEKCLLCGGELAEETVEPAAEETEAAVEETETVEAPAAEETAEPAPKKSRTGLIAGIAAAAVALVAVILVKGGNKAEAPVVESGDSVVQEEVTEQPAEQELVVSGDVVAAGHHINAYGYDSYSVYYEIAEDGTVSYYQMMEDGVLHPVAAAEVEQLRDAVIATCGDMGLTNRHLAYYYEQQFYNLQSMYSSYLPYFLNTAMGFDEQLSMDGTCTWQEFLMEGSVEQFQQIAALAQTAAAEGISLSQEELDYLETNANFDDIAVSYGLADGQALMEAQFGPGATEESYLEFMKTVLLANVYTNNLLQGMEVSDEEMEAYYDANAEMMVSTYRALKVDKNVVNVRHILISPTAAEDGTISDEAWAEAEAEAQRIYEEWLTSGATEEAFAQAATAYSQDGGSQSNGGLYTDVQPGKMTTEFNDWCFADGRKAGDHGIVKTTYGYHVMYFSGEGDYIFWRMAAEDLCRQEKTMAKIEEITATFAPTVDLSKAMMMAAVAPTVPTVEETPAE